MLLNLILLVVVITQWSIIYTMVRSSRRKPKLISMSELQALAVDAAQKSGCSYTEAFRAMMGALNYGGRFTK